MKFFLDTANLNDIREAAAFRVGRRCDDESYSDLERRRRRLQTAHSCDLRNRSGTCVPRK